MLRGVGNLQTTSTSGTFTGLTDGSGNILPIRYAFANGGVPVGIPPSGSVAANGALTVTALDNVYSGGIYLFFPAGALFAGSSAGLYWTVMSSTTAGTVYQNTYTSGTPAIPTSPTPIVAAGPGAYVQSTSEITLRTHNLPANSLGINGTLTTSPMAVYSSSANTKLFRMYLGGTLLHTGTRTTQTLDYWGTLLVNRGVANIQVRPNQPSQTVGATNSVTISTINMAVDNALTYTGQLANSADFMVMQSLLAEVIPA